MLPVSDFKIIKKKNLNLIGKIKVKVLIVAACLVIILFFAQLVFANSLAVDGIRLVEIEREIARLEAENTTLKVKIADETSLRSLSKKAKESGFEKSSVILVP